MSTLSTKVLQIEEILNFPDPPGIPEENKTTSLELIKVGGWYCVSSKSSNNFIGKKVVMVEPDSCLPQKLLDRAFEGSKMTVPSNGRIRAAKIRGVISPGLVLSLDVCGLSPNTPLNTEVSSKLGITKYSPPEIQVVNNSGKDFSIKKVHSDFSKMTDIENIKRYDHAFQNGEEVAVSIKIHGISARYGYCKTSAGSFILPRLVKGKWKIFFRHNLNTLKNKILLFLKRLPEYEFVCGSRNQEVYSNTDIFYNENLWIKIAKQLNLEERLKEYPGLQVYGEIFGHGIQSNFSYGLEGQEFLVYDVRQDGKWLDHNDMVKVCQELTLQTVPFIYIGPYSFEKIEDLRNGSGHNLDKNIPCREGVIIKPIKERSVPVLGRLILKAISDKYYLAKTTDYQ